MPNENIGTILLLFYVLHLEVERDKKKKKRRGSFPIIENWLNVYATIYLPSTNLCPREEEKLKVVTV